MIQRQSLLSFIVNLQSYLLQSRHQIQEIGIRVFQGLGIEFGNQGFLGFRDRIWELGFFRVFRDGSWELGFLGFRVQRWNQGYLGFRVLGEKLYIVSESVAKNVEQRERGFQGLGKSGLEPYIRVFFYSFFALGW